MKIPRPWALVMPEDSKTDTTWKVSPLMYRALNERARVKAQNARVDLASFRVKSRSGRLGGLDFLFRSFILPSALQPQSSGLSRKMIRTKTAKMIPTRTARKIQAPLHSSRSIIWLSILGATENPRAENIPSPALASPLHLLNHFMTMFLETMVSRP